MSTVASYFLFKNLVESPWTYQPTNNYDDAAVSEIIDTSELNPVIDEEISHFYPDDVEVDPALTLTET